MRHKYPLELDVGLVADTFDQHAGELLVRIPLESTAKEIDV
jgi:hypothetical protein